MTNNTAPVQSKLVKDRERLKSAHPLDKYSSALSAIPFVVALAASLVFFRIEGNRTTLVFDSAHYFQSTELLYKAFTGDLSVLKELSAYLSLDGPVLPLLGGIVCMLTGHPPNASNPEILVFTQCILHGINSSLLFRLAKKLAGGTDRSAAVTALAASILFAVSPAAIMAASRYLTETVTTTLLILLTLSAHRNLSCSSFGDATQPTIPGSHAKSMFNTFGFGVVAALLILSKPALAPVALLMTIIAFAQRLSCRALMTRLASLSSGIAAVFVPWGLFNLFASGSLQLLPSRMPGWNIALGSDIETDGWSAIPIPPLLDLNYFDKPLSIIYGVFYSHPAEYIGMTIRKSARLFWQPWNDFSSSLPPFALDLNAAIHQSILLAAVCGVFYSLTANSGASTSTRRETPNPVALRLSLVSAAAVLGHLVFVPFEAIPRYAFSATPFLILLAIFFLSRTSAQFLKKWLPCLFGTVIVAHLSLAPHLVQFKLSFSAALLVESLVRSGAVLTTLSIALVEMGRIADNKKASQMTAILGVFSVVVCLAMGVAFGLNTRDRGEWKSTLGANMMAVRNVLVPPQQWNQFGEPDFVSILIDADAPNLDQCILTINGTKVPFKTHSIYDVPNPYRYQQTLLHTVQSQADAEGVTRDELRQWRMVNIPRSLVGGGWNQIVLAGPAKGTATIYGDYKNASAVTNRIHLPSLHAFAVCKIQAGFGPRDGRPVDIIGLPARQANCYLVEQERQQSSTDLSSDSGEQTGTFRMFLLTGRKSSAEYAQAVDGLTFGNRIITVY